MANKGKAAQIAERRAEAIKLRAAGTPWSDIATTLGYNDRAHACIDVQRALQERTRDLALAADELRELELEHLDHLRGQALAILVKHRLDVGDTSDETALKAIDRLVRLSERKARMLGLDADAKQMERLVELEEGKARLVAAVIERVINSSDIDLTDEQREAQRAAAVRELRALPAAGLDAHSG